jgi:hypothetical protein
MGAHGRRRACRKSRSLFALLLGSALGCGSATPAKSTAMSDTATISISSDPTSTTSDSAPPTADAKTYPIHLRRHEHVGGRERVVVDYAEDDVMSFHVASRRKEIAHKHLVKHLHLEGEWTTTALDPHQDEARATLHVAKLTEDDAILLKNKQIDIIKGVTRDGATLTIDGKPISAKTRKALDQLVPLRIESSSSDAAVLGTEQPQSVGGHWPIDGARAKDDLLADTDVSSTAVSGEATLVGVEHVGGVDVLRIKVDFEIDGMVYPLHHPGATCEPAQGKSVTTAVYPLDENQGLLEAHTSFAVTTRIHVPGPRGISVIGDVDSAVQRDAYITPL